MTSLPGPLFTKPPRRVILFWAVLAALNLTAGVVVATNPARATDLESIMRWGRAWLAGENIYHPPDSGADYPPHAIVLLAPLGVLPTAVAVPIWVMLNMVFACLAPYFAARFFRPHDSFRVIVLPVLMFLCWGGNRALTQFSLLALTFAMAALVAADRKPLASGALLGLALMKPQVAVPVFLWAVFTRRWRVVLTSLAVVASGTAVFCVWAGAEPLAVVDRYAGILAMYHTGDAILQGLGELRPLVRLAAAASDVDAIAGSIGIGLLAGICIAGVREGRVRTRVLYAAPPLTACWSLLTFYHLTYGFVVLLPVMMLLALHDTERSSLRVRLFWGLQLALMFDLPGIGRRSGLSALPFLRDVLPHADRGLLVTLFIGLVVLAWREYPEAATA